jgi:hypothetical protein
MHEPLIGPRTTAKIVTIPVSRTAVCAWGDVKVTQAVSDVLPVVPNETSKTGTDELFAVFVMEIVHLSIVPVFHEPPAGGEMNEPLTKVRVVAIEF